MTDSSIFSKIDVPVSTEDPYDRNPFLPLDENRYFNCNPRVFSFFTLLLLHLPSLLFVLSTTGRLGRRIRKSRDSLCGRFSIRGLDPSGFPLISHSMSYVTTLWKVSYFMELYTMDRTKRVDKLIYKKIGTKYLIFWPKDLYSRMDPRVSTLSHVESEY